MSIYVPNQGNGSRIPKYEGRVSRDGRMVVKNGIWVWTNSGLPVSPKNRYRSGYRRY